MRTFSLGAGKDTVVFSSKAEADANTITNFGADDVLQFKTTASQLFDGLGTLATSGALESVGSSAKSITGATTKVYKDTYDNLKNLQGTSSYNGKVVVAVATDADDKGGIYAVTLKSSAVATSIVKVGTLTGVDLNDLTMANFATIA